MARSTGGCSSGTPTRSSGRGSEWPPVRCRSTGSSSRREHRGSPRSPARSSRRRRALVIHCQVGKDRTGLAVALVLSAVGVTDDAIAADYALSAGCLQPHLDYRRTLDAAPNSEPADGMTSPPGTMLALLGEMHETRGGAAGYLRAGGLTAHEVGALRRRLIE